MSKEAKSLMNKWADRKVSHWEKKNDFKMWENLSPLQRKCLVKDIREHLCQMFELGRQSMIDDVQKIK